MGDNSIISNSDHLSNTSDFFPSGGNVSVGLLLFLHWTMWGFPIYFGDGGVYSLYILDIKPLTDIWLTQFFSKSVGHFLS